MDWSAARGGRARRLWFRVVVVVLREPEDDRRRERRLELDDDGVDGRAHARGRRAAGR